MTIRMGPIAITAFLFIACGGPKQSFHPDPVASVEDGEVLIENGQYEEAAKLFESILENDPENPRAHYYMGYCRSAMGDDQAAISEYQEAISLDGTLMVAHNNLGLLLLDSGDLNGAETALGIVLENAQSDGDAHFNMGMLREAQGRTKDALVAYQKAAELNPEDPAPLLAMGDMEKSAGNKEAALEKFAEAHRRAPEDPVPVVSQGQLLLELGRTDEAREILLALLDFADADAFLLTSAGLLLSRARNDEAAIQLYRAAVVKDEEFARVHVLLGNALARSGNFAEAILHFERYLEMSPDSSEAEAARRALEASKAAVAR